MFEQYISEADVQWAIATGITIKEYPEDRPLPSKLLLAEVRSRPLHTVVAWDQEGGCYVVTAYWPDPKLWLVDFRTRKTQ